MVDVINEAFGAGTAISVDARTIQVAAPADLNGRVDFLSRVENMEVRPGEGAAKVILNARTGSVVMNQSVTLDNCAIAHGNLTVTITSEPVISQPAPFSQGQTVQTQKDKIEIRQEKGGLTMVKGVSLAEVVKALNSIGATPQDLLAILQAMKASGALRAELEII